MKFGLLLCCLVLVGCATVESFPILEMANTKEITLIRTWDAARICSRLVPPKSDSVTVACAIMRDTCIIYVEPTATNDTWGHELRHCFDGRWHK